MYITAKIHKKEFNFHCPLNSLYSMGFKGNDEFPLFVASSAQRHIVVAPNDHLFRFSCHTVRENRQSPISAHPAKCGELLYFVRIRNQIKQRPKSLPAKIAVQSANMHLFLIRIYHFHNRGHKIGEELPLINQNNIRIHPQRFVG